MGETRSAKIGFPLRGILVGDLRVLVFSFFVWSTGMGLYQFVWPLYLKEVADASATQVGLAVALAALVGAVAFLPGGFLADRFDRKKVMLSTWVLGVPAPLLWWLATDWTLVVAGIVLYFISFASIPAETALIADRVKQARRGTSFGLVYASFPLGWALGAFVGTAVLPTVGLRALFLLAFPLFCVAFVAGVLYLRPSPSHPFPRWERGTLASLRWSLPLVVLPAALLGVLNLAFNFAPLYLDEIKGLEEWRVELVGAVAYLSSAPLGILLGHLADRRGVPRTLALASLLLAGGLVILLLAPSPLMLLNAPLLGFFYVARILGDTGVAAAAAVGRGRAYGLYFAIEATAIAVGSAAGGLLYDFRQWLPFVVGLGLLPPTLVLLYLLWPARPTSLPPPVATAAGIEGVGR